MSSYVSIDGGETWDGPHQAPYLNDDLGGGGDPSLAFDQAGNVHMTEISIGDQQFDVGPITVDTLVSSIAVTTLRRRRLHLADDHLDGPQRRQRQGARRRPVRPHPRRGLDRLPGQAVDRRRAEARRSVQGRDLRHLHQLRGQVPDPLPGRDPSAHPGLDRHDDPDGPLRGRRQDMEQAGRGQPDRHPELRRRERVATRPPRSEKRTVQGSQPAVTPDGTVYVTWVDCTDDEAMKGKGADQDRQVDRSAASRSARPSPPPTSTRSASARGTPSSATGARSSRRSQSVPRARSTSPMSASPRRPARRRRCVPRGIDR